MNPDHKLQRLVLAALDADPAIDCSHIGVVVRDAIVTLSGHVPSNAEKRAAEVVAGRVAGVRAVIDDVLVELPGRRQTADEAIAERCYEKLAANLSVPLDRIHIGVKAGVVTLHGDVDHEHQRQVAEAELRGLRVVGEVLNELVVRPPVRVETVRDKIRLALAALPDGEAEAIEVRVNGSHVTLRGTVGSWRARSLAESAVWSVPGVSGIDDQIVVA